MLQQYCCQKRSGGHYCHQRLHTRIVTRCGRITQATEICALPHLWFPISPNVDTTENMRVKQRHSTYQRCRQQRAMSRRQRQPSETNEGGCFHKKHRWRDKNTTMNNLRELQIPPSPPLQQQQHQEITINVRNSHPHFGLSSLFSKQLSYSIHEKRHEWRGVWRVAQDVEGQHGQGGRTETNVHVRTCCTKYEKHRGREHAPRRRGKCGEGPPYLIHRDPATFFVFQ